MGSGNKDSTIPGNMVEDIFKEEEILAPAPLNNAAADLAMADPVPVSEPTGTNPESTVTKEVLDQLFPSGTPIPPTQDKIIKALLHYDTSKLNESQRKLVQDLIKDAENKGLILNQQEGPQESLVPSIKPEGLSVPKTQKQISQEMVLNFLNI